MQTSDLRWKAVITYRSVHGDVDVDYYFDEIVELDEIIEAGPHFDTMLHCVITPNRLAEGISELTVEKAETL